MTNCTPNIVNTERDMHKQISKTCILQTLHQNYTSGKPPSVSDEQRLNETQTRLRHHLLYMAAQYISNAAALGGYKSPKI